MMYSKKTQEGGTDVVDLYITDKHIGQPEIDKMGEYLISLSREDRRKIKGSHVDEFPSPWGIISVIHNPILHDGVMH